MSSSKRPYAPRLPPEQRGEQLLDAALALALDRGFHAVTIDGVARQAGVTRPVVYGAFTDLAALLQALAARSEARVLAQLADVYPALPAPDSDIDPDALVVEGITAYLTAVRDNPADWTVILLPPEGAPAQMQARVNAHRRELLARLRALADWGLHRPERSLALDPDLFARSVFTLAEGAARLILIDPGRWQVQQFADFTREALAALRGPTSVSRWPSN